MALHGQNGNAMAGTTTLRICSRRAFGLLSARLVARAAHTVRRSHCIKAAARLFVPLVGLVVLGSCQGPRYAETEIEQSEHRRKEREAEFGWGLGSFLEGLIPR